MKIVMYLDSKPIAELSLPTSNLHLSKLISQLKEDHKEAIMAAKDRPKFILTATSQMNDFTPLGGKKQI